ncbi:hypothetical protein NMY22_g14522 [Coprinellus aureogranulatus]|nr:hypothetical protein NMY22_g14522 [Coprinellus aureogranulatus]
MANGSPLSPSFTQDHDWCMSRTHVVTESESPGIGATLAPANSITAGTPACSGQSSVSSPTRYCSLAPVDPPERGAFQLCRNHLSAAQGKCCPTGSPSLDVPSKQRGKAGKMVNSTTTSPSQWPRICRSDTAPLSSATRSWAKLEDLFKDAELVLGLVADARRQTVERKAANDRIRARTKLWTIRRVIFPSCPPPDFHARMHRQARSANDWSPPPILPAGLSGSNSRGNLTPSVNAIRSSSQYRIALLNSLQWYIVKAERLDLRLLLLSSLLLHLHQLGGNHLGTSAGSTTKRCSAINSVSALHRCIRVPPFRQIPDYSKVHDDKGLSVFNEMDRVHFRREAHDPIITRVKVKEKLRIPFIV